MVIRIGKINDLTKDYRGWIIGSFVDKSSQFYSKDFEVKWVDRKKGEFKENTNNSINNQKTFCILVSGKMQYEFIGSDESVILQNPGEYIFYEPTVPHKSTALEDSVSIVIRWPSIDCGC